MHFLSSFGLFSIAAFITTFIDDAFRVSTYFTRHPRLTNFPSLKFFPPILNSFVPQTLSLAHFNNKTKIKTRKIVGKNFIPLHVLSQNSVIGIMYKNIYLSCYTTKMKINFNSSLIFQVKSSKPKNVIMQLHSNKVQEKSIHFLEPNVRELLQKISVCSGSFLF